MENHYPQASCLIQGRYHARQVTIIFIQREISDPTSDLVCLFYDFCRMAKPRANDAFYPGGVITH